MISTCQIVAVHPSRPAAGVIVVPDIVHCYQFCPFPHVSLPLPLLDAHLVSFCHDQICSDNYVMKNETRNGHYFFH